MKPQVKAATARADEINFWTRKQAKHSGDVSPTGEIA
jgi:hypothetical protein